MSDNRKFVIFDLDGTLIDSYECVLRCINKTLCRFGENIILNNDSSPEIGIIFNLIFSKYFNIPREEFKNLFDKIHRIDTDGITEINSSVSDLINYHNQGFTTVILTNKWQPIAEQIIKQLNLITFCSHIIGRKGSINFKTDILEVAKSIQDIGLNFDDCYIYYGDSIEDELIAQTYNIEFKNVKKDIF